MAVPPFRVKAVYEYTSEHDDDLKFPIGQIINVTELEGDDWYVGEYTDTAGVKQEGLFPKNFVEKYEPEVPVRPTRAARPKSVLSPPPAELEQRQPQGDEPPTPATSKPQAPPVEIPPALEHEEKLASPTPASSDGASKSRADPPPAPKPAAVEPAPAASTPAKAAPPPVAPKSNAFKDRIAAFNRVEQAPLAPIGPGRQQPRNDYIKKPFVAPPPSKNAYVPTAPKVEPVHRPYIREEDPEIRQRQEEDRAAAEAAGLAGDSAPAAEETEDTPKPMSLKERMAMLQREQEAARARHADAAAQHKKERKPPPRKVEHEETNDGDEELERVASTREAGDAPKDKPRVPSAHRRPPEPLSPVPAAPAHEILSGGEEADQSAAGETTEDDVDTIGPDDSEARPVVPIRAPAAPAREPDVGDEEDVVDDDEEEEEELDEEELRKQRLRERMARLAGGQQGGGPFNPFGMPPAPAAAKKRPTKERKTSEDAVPSAAPQIPQMVAIPGMGRMPLPRMQSPESDQTQKAHGEEGDDGEADDEESAAPPRPTATDERSAPPPIPKDRPAPSAPAHERAAPPPLPSESTRPTPRQPPAESRAVPPPPPPAAAIQSPGPGSESDDEMSLHAKRPTADTSGVETPLPIRTGPPPIPSSRDALVDHVQSPSSATSDKRASRVPPIPGDSSIGSQRPPPPPPPGGMSRQNTDQLTSATDETERGESEYEGDYDTDIASSAKHKEALKAHNREPSQDDSTTADEMTPETTQTMVPPIPTARAVPPPPPHGTARSRPSMETPRAPPPAPPPTREATNDEYDPYKYDGRAPPPVPTAMPIAAQPIMSDEPDTIQDESSADELPASTTAPQSRKSVERPPPPPPTEVERPPPMPPTPQHASAPPSRAPTLPRQSMEAQRKGSIAGRSIDLSRAGGDMGQIAQDVDLAHDSQWWTAARPLPPSLQSRNGVDLLSESEESQKSKRGGRTTITKDIYILYMDYSQTVVTAQYDSKDPADVILEQRHEPPPPKLRQDQLEAYWQRFGARIAEAANAAGNSKRDKDAHVIGDGSPAALPHHLIANLQDALLPVGTRAYGALVYANLANASTQQFDEIRAGDIITVRNGRFEGHHGTMRQKYRAEYGAFHVAVVEEWDGTKRSVRAWEQGREKKAGVRSEKFRLGDLRSGEVRVWRVVGRDWVGWESG